MSLKRKNEDSCRIPTEQNQNKQEQEQEEDVPFNKFEPIRSTLAKPFILGQQPEISLFTTISIYGKRKSGKSFFLRWFFDYYRIYYPYVWVFTYTKHNLNFKTYIPESSIFGNFNGQALEKIMQRQIEAGKITLNQDSSFNCRAAIFWDDYNGDDIQYNQVLNNYYFTGRHFYTMNIFCAQYPKITPPAIRSNTDYAVLFNTDRLDTLETFWKEFAGKLRKDEFIAMFRQYVEDTPHGFLFIDNDPNVDYKNKFFYGVAKKVKINIKHVACCAEAWQDDRDQLHKIADGTYARQIDMIADLSKPKKRKRDDLLKSRYPTLRKGDEKHFKYHFSAS